MSDDVFESAVALEMLFCKGDVCFLGFIRLHVSVSVAQKQAAFLTLSFFCILLPITTTVGQEANASRWHQARNGYLDRICIGMRYYRGFMGRGFKGNVDL